MEVREEAAMIEERKSESSTKREKYTTYFGRYYVLVAISLLSAQQNLSWATFGPIADEARLSYGLTAIEVTLLPGRPINYHNN